VRTANVRVVTQHESNREKQLASNARSSYATEVKMTDLGQQAMMLKTVYRRLLLYPENELARREMARAIAVVPLVPDQQAGGFVHWLADEARAHAERLAFRLESGSHDRLYITTTAAMLCQALALLALQLSQRRGQSELGTTL
jgi:hypothetical protein